MNPYTPPFRALSSSHGYFVVDFVVAAAEICCPFVQIKATAAVVVVVAAVVVVAVAAAAAAAAD